MSTTSKNIYKALVGGLLATTLCLGITNASPAFAQDGPPGGELMGQDGDRSQMMERRRRGGMRGERRNRRNRGDKMGRLGKFLKGVSNFSDTVKEPHNAIGLSVLTIKDHYRKAGKPAEAIPELEQFLGMTRNQSARNLILFNIRQIYEETRQKDKALAISKQIMTENLKAVK